MTLQQFTEVNQTLTKLENEMRALIYDIHSWEDWAKKIVGNSTISSIEARACIFNRLAFQDEVLLNRIRELEEENLHLRQTGGPLHGASRH